MVNNLLKLNYLTIYNSEIINSICNSFSLTKFIEDFEDINYTDTSEKSLYSLINLHRLITYEEAEEFNEFFLDYVDLRRIDESNVIYSKAVQKYFKAFQNLILFELQKFMQTYANQNVKTTFDTADTSSILKSLNEKFNVFFNFKDKNILLRANGLVITNFKEEGFFEELRILLDSFGIDLNFSEVISSNDSYEKIIEEYV